MELKSSGKITVSLGHLASFYSRSEQPGWKLEIQHALKEDSDKVSN